MAKIVISTLGFPGQLDPLLGLGKELLDRGHRVGVNTGAAHEPDVLEAGLDFQPTRPNIDPRDGEFVERFMDPNRGPEHLIKETVMPHLRESFEDCRKAIQGADLLVADLYALQAQLAAERDGVPRVTTALSPLCFRSSHDPPVLPNAPGLSTIPGVGSWLSRGMMEVGRRFSDGWVKTYKAFCGDIGVESNGHPLFEGFGSSRLVLALFSRQLGEKQPDWPDQTVITGFVFHDRGAGGSEWRVLEDFLESGDAPLTFTLGPALSRTRKAREFFNRALEASEELEERVVIEAGPRYARLLKTHQNDRVFVADSLPGSTLFRRSKGVVHPGSVRRLGQAMLAGRPMLVVPFGQEQFDNAHRVKNLGTGVTLPFTRYNRRTLLRRLRKLLGEDSFAEKAAQVRRGVLEEEGTKTAVDEIETVLERTLPSEESA